MGSVHSPARPFSALQFPWCYYNTAQWAGDAHFGGACQILLKDISLSFIMMMCCIERGKVLRNQRKTLKRLS